MAGRTTFGAESRGVRTVVGDRSSVGCRCRQTRRPGRGHRQKCTSKKRPDALVATEGSDRWQDHQIRDGIWSNGGLSNTRRSRRTESATHSRHRWGRSVGCVAQRTQDRLRGNMLDLRPLWLQFSCRRHTRRPGAGRSRSRCGREHADGPVDSRQRAILLFLGVTPARPPALGTAPPRFPAGAEPTAGTRPCGLVRCEWLVRGTR